LYQGLSDGAPIMALTGNKCDLEERRQVNSGEVEAFAREHKLLFTETSAKTGRNVVEIFEQLAKKVSKLQPVMKDDNNFTLDDSLTERKKKSKCC
jgi:Ras-related protein Rab-5C